MHLRKLKINEYIKGLTKLKLKDYLDKGYHFNYAPNNYGYTTNIGYIFKDNSFEYPYRLRLDIGSTKILGYWNETDWYVTKVPKLLSFKGLQ